MDLPLSFTVKTSRTLQQSHHPVEEIVGFSVFLHDALENLTEPILQPRPKSFRVYRVSDSAARSFHQRGFSHVQRFRMSLLSPLDLIMKDLLQCCYPCLGAF